MFVDSDDELLNPMEMHSDFRDCDLIRFEQPKSIITDGQEEFLLPVIEKREGSPHDFPTSSFLHRASRSTSNLPNIAQKSAIDAGCDADVINSLKNTVPSQLEGLINDLPGTDKKKMKEQLRKESIIHWDSSIIYKGLGVDDYTGLSITRLNDLLCNANEHLLLIQRDITQHSQAITEARQNGTVDSLGFSNEENRSRLRRICYTIIKASRELAEHVEKLADTDKEGEGSTIKLIAAVGLTATVSAAVIFAFFYYK